MLKLILAFLLIPLSWLIWYLLKLLDISLGIRSLVLIALFIVSSLLFVFGTIEVVRGKRC